MASEQSPRRRVLGLEHQRYEWLSMSDAAARLTWPREREALQHIRILLGTGDAGPAEDVACGWRQSLARTYVSVGT